ncbi:MAG: methyltransferase [Acidimicrobiia bacterium]|nr:methyltransferase [Acidimicrobiia bacterium]
MSAPPKILSRESMVALNQGLREAGMNATALCERTGAPSIGKIELKRDGRKIGVTLETPLDVLLRLNVDQEFVPADDFERIMPSGLGSLLIEAGLVEESESGYLAASIIYPMEDEIICSDRAMHPDDRPFELPADSVYFASNSGTITLLGWLPKSRPRKFLEICGGAGAIAITMARTTNSEVWSADISERCTAFASFSAALNGAEQFHGVTGDLYQPVAGQQFDLIAVHPPYVPEFETRVVFRDGGRDGETILRRCVEGLPAALAPGGSAYIVTLMTDRKDGMAQDRIRRWLGDAHEEFDVFMLNDWTHHIADSMFTSKEVVDRAGLRAYLTSIGVEHQLYGLVIIRRHDGVAAPWSIRRKKGAGWTADGLDRMMDLASAVSSPELFRSLRDIPLYVPDGVQMQLRHEGKGGRLQPPSVYLSTGNPVPVEGNYPDWSYGVLMLADGVRTAGDLFEELKNQGALGADPQFGDFLQTISWMFASGFLLPKNLSHLLEPR